MSAISRDETGRIDLTAIPWVAALLKSRWFTTAPLGNDLDQHLRSHSRHIHLEKESIKLGLG